MSAVCRVRRLLSSATCSKGQSLIETALVLPVLLLMMLNTMNFATYIFAWITVNNAARAALEYRVYNGVAIGFAGAPSFSDVCSVWSQDVSSLPNVGSYTSGSCSWTNATLQICSRVGSATPVCSGSTALGTFTPSTTDPGSYTQYTASVTYHYTPFVSAFSIPGGISLSPPAGTIERHFSMRAMN